MFSEIGCFPGGIRFNTGWNKRNFLISSAVMCNVVLVERCSIRSVSNEESTQGQKQENAYQVFKYLRAGCMSCYS